MATQSATDVARSILAGFQALADETRLRVVEALRNGERCVCDLQDLLDVGQSLLSHHLRVLRDAGLVRDRRDGRWVHYSLDEEALRDLEEFLRDVRAEPGTNQPSSGCCP